MAYDNNLKGIISKNDRKEKDTHPDIKGQCEIDGVAYWISGWRKERNDGSGSFYSLSFEPKQKQAKPEPQRKPSHDAFKARQTRTDNSGFDTMTDDVPFADPMKSKAFCLSV